MGRVRLALVGLLVLVLAACSGSSPSATEGGGGAAASSAPPASQPASQPASTEPSMAPSTEPSAMPSEASAMPSDAASEQTAAPTAVDPCKLVPASEASQLAGVKFGKGSTSTFSGNGKICTYNAGTLNIFTVTVAKAPDQQAADTAKQDVIDQMNSALGTQVKITPVPDLGDTAAIASVKTKVGGQTVNVIGFYALKGTTFFAFSNVSLGNNGPSEADMKAEAQTVLGRIP